MYKLLPEETKKKVTHEYIIRRSIMIIAALISLLFLGIIGITPSYVLSTSRQNEVLKRARIIKDVKLRGDEADLKKWLADFNRKIEALNPALDTDQPTKFIDEILSRRVAGIRIVGFSWVKNKDKTSISVSGVASNRETLITFENNIRSSDLFSEVVLPISNLASGKNINFQIKLTPNTPDKKT